MTTQHTPEDRAIVGAAERVAQSLREEAEQRFTAQGARAPFEAQNPYMAGSAAATWWQRGHDNAKAKAMQTAVAKGRS